MKKWIKPGSNANIIDVFFDYQKSKFDGTEIFFEETDVKEHKINGKSISDKYGNFIFTYIDGVVKELAENEIYTGSRLNEYKILRRDELRSAIKGNWLDVDKTMDQIKTAYTNFKADVILAETKEAVDTLFDTAYSWLGL